MGIFDLPLLFILIQSLTIDLSCQSLQSEQFEVRPYAGKYGMGSCEGSTLTWHTFSHEKCDFQHLITTDIYPLDVLVCMATSPATQVDHRFLDFLHDFEGLFGCASQNNLRFNSSFSRCINSCHITNNCLELSSETITGNCANQPDTMEATSAVHDCENRHVVTSYYAEENCARNWTSRKYLWWEFNRFYNYPGSQTPTIWQFKCEKNIFSKKSQQVIYTDIEPVNMFYDYRFNPDDSLCVTTDNFSWEGKECDGSYFSYFLYPEGCNDTQTGYYWQIIADGGCNNAKRDTIFGVGQSFRAWCYDDHTVRIQQCTKYARNSPASSMVELPDDSPSLLDPYSPVWFYMVCIMFGMIFCILGALFLKFCISYKEFIVDTRITDFDPEYSEMQDTNNGSGDSFNDLWHPAAQSYSIN